MAATTRRRSERRLPNRLRIVATLLVVTVNALVATGTVIRMS